MDSKKWYEYAKRDLEMAKYAYAHRYYPQALFALQQSVEKASKGAIVDIGLLWPQEVFSNENEELLRRFGLEKFKVNSLKEFGHDWVDQLIKMLKPFRDKWLSNLSSLESYTLKIAGCDKSAIKKVKNYLKSLNLNKISLKSSEDETIANLIEEYPKLIKSIKKMAKIDSIQLLAIQSSIFSSSRLLKEAKLANKKRFNFNFLYKTLKKTYILLLIFSVLSMVLVKYVGARYPDFKETEEALRKKIIVGRFLEVSELIEKTIAYLEK